MRVRGFPQAILNVSGCVLAADLTLIGLQNHTFLSLGRDDQALEAINDTLDEFAVNLRIHEGRVAEFLVHTQERLHAEETVKGLHERILAAVEHGDQDHGRMEEQTQDWEDLRGAAIKHVDQPRVVFAFQALKSRKNRVLAGDTLAELTTHVRQEFRWKCVLDCTDRSQGTVRDHDEGVRMRRLHRAGRVLPVLRLAEGVQTLVDCGLGI